MASKTEIQARSGEAEWKGETKGKQKTAAFAELPPSSYFGATSRRARESRKLKERVDCILRLHRPPYEPLVRMVKVERLHGVHAHQAIQTPVLA